MIATRDPTALRSTGMAPPHPNGKGPACLIMGLITLLGQFLPLQAEVTFQAAAKEPAVFSGSTDAIAIMIQHDETDRITQDYSVRMVQRSAALRLPIGSPRPWTRIVLEPGQALQESVPVTLPQLRAITAFQVEILQGSQCVARIPFWGCPTNLMQHLSAMVGSAPIGLYDPEGRLAPGFQQASIPWEPLEPDLRKRAIPCPLAILGPFPAGTAVPEEAAALADHLRHQNIAVILLVPPGTLQTNDAEVSCHLLPGKAASDTASLLKAEWDPSHGLDGAAGQLSIFRWAEKVMGLASTTTGSPQASRRTSPSNRTP